MINLSAFAFEIVEVGVTSKGLTLSTFAPVSGMAEKAFITIEGDCRYRYDGGNPSYTEGHLLKDGNYIVLNGDLQIKNFRAISLSNDTKLQVSYERP